MKKITKRSSKKMHNTETSIGQLRKHDLSNKVKAVNKDTRMDGRQAKIIRLNIPGEGLQKFKKR
jgi:hypothetical protein